MIYVTGDLHGDKEQINIYLEKLSELNKSDVLIIAGDFGIPWWTEKISYWKYYQDIKLLKKLANAPFTLCFVDGNHENYDLLKMYPLEKKWGGLVQNIEGVYHLLRGELYTIDGNRIFTFGGATSTDKRYRTEHISWWEEENASQEEKDKGIAVLERTQWNVDYVITHQAPEQFYQVFVQAMIGNSKMNCITQAYLTEICNRLTYKKWYFGHYHADINSEPVKCRLLFNDIVELGK